jgi:hypothetical protein
MRFILLDSPEETLWIWVKSHFPFLTIVVCAMIATAYITHLVISLYHRYKKTESKCEDLHDVQVPNVTRKIDDSNIKLATIITQLAKITTYLTTKFDVDHQLFQTNSPKELTKLGSEILKATGGDKFVDDNLTGLLGLMEKQDFKSGLDVENYCTVLLFEKINEDSFTPIKNYIFQNPEYKTEVDKKLQLDINVAIQVMSIYLRNKYFEKHPSLKEGM